MSLRLYPVMLELVRLVAPLIDVIARHDPDLARQAKRALTSGPLNVAEGMHSRGRNRPVRYQTAMASMNELRSCLEVAEVLGYTAIPERVAGLLRQVIGTLHRLVVPLR